MNELIASRAWDVVRGNPLLDGTERGWCLQAVRRVVEASLGWDDHELYWRYGVARTTQGRADRTDWTWWAADIEAAMKELDLAVPAEHREPGDLVFRYLAARPYGHVAIFLGHDLVLEVIDPAHRPRSMFRGDIAVTPYGYWEPTLVARLTQT